MDKIFPKIYKYKEDICSKITNILIRERVFLFYDSVLKEEMKLSKI